jgi:hypothetical protein
MKICASALCLTWVMLAVGITLCQNHPACPECHERNVEQIMSQQVGDLRLFTQDKCGCPFLILGGECLNICYKTNYNCKGCHAIFCINTPKHLVHQPCSHSSKELFMASLLFPVHPVLWPPVKPLLKMTIQRMKGPLNTNSSHIPH